MPWTSSSQNRKLTGEKGYSWLSLPKSPAHFFAIILSIITVLIAWILFVSYVGGASDHSPDSPLGLAFALIGTTLLLAATLIYWKTRRSHRRRVGQLHRALIWHMLFGGLTFFFLLLHSAGNFNPRSGTYALYGMIVTVVTGAGGRILDRLLPRVGTYEMQQHIVDEHGESQLESLLLKKPGIGHAVRYQSKDWSPESAQVSFGGQGVSWQYERQVRLDAAKKVQQAIYREQLYRSIIRLWRVLHKGVVVITLGLTVWHIIYALQLFTQ